MSKSFGFTVSSAHQARGAGVRRNQSTASVGVDVRIQGWRAGIQKVTLSQTFKAGGTTLTEAADLTGRIMKGEAVEVHLSQFATVDEARRALSALGIQDVSEVEPETDPTPFPGP